MLNEVTRISQGQTWEEMFNHHQTGLKLANDHYTPSNDCPTTTLSQQLISDLAELRESTTIIDHNPAERVQYRLTRTFESEALLPWPPTCSSTSPRYDFYNDYVSEESSSPSLSVVSQPSELANYDGYVAVAESPMLSCNLLPRFNQGSPMIQSTAPSPARKITHIIGEDDPFNPFSYDPILEDKYTRSIDTLNGRIFAPMPKLPTTAALANFEAIAFEAMMPAAKSVIETDPSSNNNETAFSDDETSPLLFFSTESTPLLKENRRAPAVASIWQPDTADGDILYRTGPRLRVKLVDDMISFLSLESGPLKSEMMKQLWLSNDHGAAETSSRDSASKMTEDEVYEALIPVPPQPPYRLPYE